MNKSDLVNAVAKEANLTKTDANLVIDAIVQTITEALKNDDAVKLIGFGVFITAKRPETKGRNPRTGETINIPEKRLPRFRPGILLKNSIAENTETLG